MKLKNIIFDWSGTLWDDFELSLISTNKTLRHFGGCVVTLAEYRNQFELPVSHFYCKRGCKADVDAINEYYFHQFAPLASRAKPFKGVPQLLKKLQALGYKLYLCSTVRQDILETVCDRYKIRSCFEGVYGSVIDKAAALPAIIRNEKIKASETLFIGDMDHDLIAAKKNGLLAGAIFTGYHSEERLLAQSPDFVWNDHAGLMRSLKQLVAPPLPDPLPKGARGKFPISTVGALIFNKGDIFLIQTHKWGHTFGIPGGKIKLGETAIDALKREIKEETALKIKNIRWAMVHDSINSQEFYKKGSHFLLLNYYASSDSRKFKLNDESESGFWINPKLALKLRLNQPTRALLEEYLQNPDGI